MVIEYKFFGGYIQSDLEAKLFKFTNDNDIRSDEIIKITHTSTHIVEHDNEGDTIPSIYESVMLVYQRVMTEEEKHAYFVKIREKHEKNRATATNTAKITLPNLTSGEE